LPNAEVAAAVAEAAVNVRAAAEVAAEAGNVRVEIPEPASIKAVVNTKAANTVLQSKAA